MQIRIWDTPKPILDLDRAITLVFILFTLFIMIYNISVGGDFHAIFQQQSVTIFILFLLVISYFSVGTSFYAGFGSPRNAAISILFGTAVGVLAFSAGTIKLGVPMAITLSTATILSGIYIALVIPFVEEKFFGRIVPFTLKKVMSDGWVIVVSSVIFGAFHVFAYKADLALMGAAIVFRGATILGNSLLKSSLFGDTLHYFNNIIAVLGAISR